MPQWIKVCATDEVEPEDVAQVVAGNRHLAVYRSEEGEYFATDAYCTHEGAPLCDGFVMDGIIECPRHNGRFDYRTGRALGAPAIVDLRTYAVALRDGYVHVSLEE
ncbi:MAG: non-heme iron oxygenase ferredoxin subunit [Acidimicrobiales bacterium]